MHTIVTAALYVKNSDRKEMLFTDEIYFYLHFITLQRYIVAWNVNKTAYYAYKNYLINDIDKY